MGKAINLLRNYHKSKRNLKKRAQIKSQKIRSIARKFGKHFFDGDRKYGYGGFNYNPKYKLAQRNVQRFYNGLFEDL